MVDMISEGLRGVALLPCVAEKTAFEKTKSLDFWDTFEVVKMLLSTSRHPPTGVDHRDSATQETAS